MCFSLVLNNIPKNGISLWQHLFLAQTAPAGAVGSRKLHAKTAISAHEQCASSYQNNSNLTLLKTFIAPCA
jgi:hypothetical protein